MWRAHSHCFVSVQHLSIYLSFISLCVFIAICLCSYLFSWLVLSHSLQPPWSAAHHTCLSYTISQSLLKLMSTESVMPSNHLIPCRPLLLTPSIFPSITVFSNEVAKVCLISIVSLSVYLHLSVYPSVICLCIIISVCLHIQPSI